MLISMLKCLIKRIYAKKENARKNGTLKGQNHLLILNALFLFWTLPHFQ